MQTASGKIIINYLRFLGISDDPASFLSVDEMKFITNSLTHNEERISDKRDEWGNWEHQFTKHNFSIPYLDQMVLRKAKECGILRKAVWPGNAPFAFCLTHDLDVISDYDPKQLSRRYERMLAGANGLKKIQPFIFYCYSILKSFIVNKKEDPLWYFERWCDAEKSLGFSSTFYVFVAEDKLHIYDCDLRIDDYLIFRGERITLEQFIQKLNADGFEIGLHGSYLTFDNAEQFIKQKKMLELIIGKAITTTRQHFLHYDINSTPQVHNEAGILTDSTLGFNTTVGFRAGTCFPYFLNDNILEVPQIIMDGALFNSNSLAYNEAEAKQKIKDTIDLVEETGGCLVVNYHPNYINREIWWNSYTYLLDELKKRNAWCTSMNNIYKIARKICVE